MGEYTRLHTLISYVLLLVPTQSRVQTKGKVRMQVDGHSRLLSAGDSLWSDLREPCSVNLEITCHCRTCVSAGYSTEYSTHPCYSTTSHSACVTDTRQGTRTNDKPHQWLACIHKGDQLKQTDRALYLVPIQY